MNPLLEYIQHITPFSEQSWQRLQPVITPRSFRKNDFLLEVGTISSCIYFIEGGYCRSFYTRNGNEINTGFYFENNFVTNTKSLIKNLPSEYAIQACEPLSTIRFDKIKMLEAYQSSHEIESLGRKLLEGMVADQEEHANLFRLLSPAERYDHVARTQPALLQRVSLTQLSSYLGVSRETLSRIRGRGIKK